MNIFISAPSNFSFKRTALSHGWCQLPPFEFDRQSWTLTRVFEVDGGGQPPVTATIANDAGGINAHLSRTVGKRAQAGIVRDVRHVFRLDDDLRDFYEAVENNPDFAWIAREGAGRMLRSPTVFEDLVKTICTTNCSWSLTEKMVAGLVSKLGQATRDKRRTFPTPEAMAGVDEKFYRDEIRAGYRAPYFVELAARVASKELDVESWLVSDLPTDELKREMKRVKGVGDYAAENLLKLVGRYDGLALDSWLRARFAQTRQRGRPTPDAKIARFYSRFDTWRGLALWCDMTRDWLDEADAKI